MRLPDLNWPVTLFTDMETPFPEAGVEFHGTSVTRPNLWSDMLDSWMGKPGASAVEGDTIEGDTIGWESDMAIA